MSSLIGIISRLVAQLFRRERPTLGPEDMSLRDWADLPAHHPVSDRAPC